MTVRTLRSPRACGTALLAALMGAFIAAPLLAQAPGSGGARNAGTSSGTVLDSAAIHASGVRTLAELLAGRVAGLNVTHTSGAAGFAPEVGARGATTVFGSARPFLFVDGVLQREDLHTLGPTPDGQRPAPIWDLPIEEVASVEVRLGVAGSADLDVTPGRGAVLVRTRRGTGADTNGANTLPRTRAFVDVTAARSPATFPAVVTTGGVISGRPTSRCPVDWQATGFCTPTGTVVTAPFGGKSPIASGGGMRAGVDAAGSTPFGNYRLGAIADRGTGLVGDDGMDRVDLALAFDTRLPRRVTLALDARAAQTAGHYVRWDDLMQMGIAPLAPTDAGATPPLIDPDVLLGRSTPYRVRRVTTGASMNWAVSGGLDVFARLGSDAMSRSSDQTEYLYDLVTGNEVGIVREVRTQVQTNTDVTLGLRRAGRFAGGRVQSEVAVRHGVRDLTATASTRTVLINNPPSSSDSRLFPESRDRTIRGSLRYLQRPHRALGLSIRSERSALPAATVDGPALKGADIAWTLSDEAWFPRARSLPALRLRAAYGEAADLETKRELSFLSGVVGPILPRFERTLEREVGVDATLFGGAATLRATVFTRRTRDALFLGPVFGPGGMRFEYFDRASYDSDGGELALDLTPRAIGGITVAASITASRAETVMRSLRPPSIVTTFGEGTRTYMGSGERFGNHFASRYTWNDGNQDGIVMLGEMVWGQPYDGGTSQPTAVLGATVRFAWRDRLTWGFALDSKQGHLRVDGTAAFLCQVEVCRERYVAGRSLEEQAAALSAFVPVGPAFLHDARFVRLRDLWARYRLPSGLVRGGTNAELTLSAQNVGTWSRFPGLDPETGGFAFGNLQGAAAGLPVTPTFRVGLSVVP